MKHKIRRCCCLLILMITLSSGVGGATFDRSIPVTYLAAGISNHSWIRKLTAADFSGLNTSHPVIAVNRFDDARKGTDKVGAICSRSGKILETLITDDDPAEILEKTVIEQLQKAGFTVIRTAGWNLNAEKVPTYLEADLILGGRVNVFWAESKAGFVTATIRSQVAYDWVIADIHQKKLVYQGEAEGDDTRKSLAHISDYFWTAIQTSLSQALTKAINAPADQKKK